MNQVLTAFAAMLLLAFARVPIGFAMGLVGVVGFALRSICGAALAMVGQIAIDNVMNYNFSVLPLFVLMGALFAHSRMADELYEAAPRLSRPLPRRPGHGHDPGLRRLQRRLGSSIACAATMTKVSVPIMRRYDYAPGFARRHGRRRIDARHSHSAQHLDGDLRHSDRHEPRQADDGRFPAGPAGDRLLHRRHRRRDGDWPEIGPPAARMPLADRMRASRDVWPMVLFATVALGGIYGGVFTPTEAAGIGAFGAFVSRRLARGGAHAGADGEYDPETGGDDLDDLLRRDRRADLRQLRHLDEHAGAS